VKNPDQRGGNLEDDDLVSFVERLVPQVVFFLVTALVVGSVFVTLLRRWRAS
jgi:hypothetical protein